MTQSLPTELSFPALNALARKQINHMLNLALEHAPQSKQKLIMLTQTQSKLLRIQGQSPNAAILVCCSKGNIQLLENLDADIANTSLTGMWADLAALAMSDDPQSVISQPNNSLTITGDVEWLVSIGDIIKHLDLDWRLLITRVIGTQATSFLSLGKQQLDQFLKPQIQSIKQSVQDYIFYESQSFAKTYEVEHWYNQVEALRDDVARLDARTSRILSHLSKEQP